VAKARTKKTDLLHHLTKNKKRDPNNDLTVQILKNNYNIPAKQSEQLLLLKEYVEWALNTESSNPADFPIAKRIVPYDFFLLRHKNKLFERMIEYVKYIFALKLEKKPLVSGDYTIKRIRYYDKDFGDFIRSEVTQAIQANSKINITMEPIPTSNLVPERKKDD
jgi:hypothetical protein